MFNILAITAETITVMSIEKIVIGNIWSLYKDNF